MVRELITLMMHGPSFSGKSTLVIRYVKNKVEKMLLMTMGVDIFQKNVSIDSKNVHAVIYDLGGKHMFKSMWKVFLAPADVFIIVFDLSSPKGLDDIEIYVDSIFSVKNRVPVILAGNKCDLEKKIDDEKIMQVRKMIGEKLGENEPIPYFEVSAVTGKNVNRMFEFAIRKALEFKEK